MSTTNRSGPESSESVRQWSASLPQVRQAVRFIKRRGRVTAEELVEWDARHGRRLFTWDETAAAALCRLQQAREFLNRFRAQLDGMRMRAFIHVREDEKRGVDAAAYYTVESISKHRGMREQVVADVMKRMESLASELRMWNLTRSERSALFVRLEAALDGEAAQKTA